MDGIINEKCEHLWAWRDDWWVAWAHRGQGAPSFSRLDLGEEALDAAVARLGAARPLVVDARAGDALYVPAFWPHYVEALEDTLQINYWVREVPAVLL